ncbi:MAG: GTP 3',8-cyclase MoaA [Planctomycetota bacterium]|nr:MAG: GTP 3',8-cyclase MoaA [Planctomycetota bacterium]
MNDLLGRKITYLRLSVIDRCNLRCFYCMPKGGIEAVAHKDILRFEEISRLVRLLAEEIGITKIRLTGGEPLIRRNVLELIRQLGEIEGLRDLVLTTNGLLLGKMAGDLAQAGISRVNVSLDTLRPDRFREICRGGELEPVLEGIRAAKDAGLHPVKINVVLLKGINDDEVGDFIGFAAEEEIEVRFIEFMKIGHAVAHWDENFLPANQVADEMEKKFKLASLPASRTTVKLYKIEGSNGKVGFISSASGDLCEKCNRLRLTSEGLLRPCLMSDSDLDARKLLRSGASDGEIVAAIQNLVSTKGKPACYETSRNMSRIGG